MNTFAKFLVVSSFILGLGQMGFSQQNGDAATPVVEERDFESFVALFPSLELPLEIGDGLTQLEDCPRLPRDHRLRNYDECHDYRAIGRVDLNPECIYLIHYHWCDSLSPTPFYFMQVYSTDGKLLTTAFLATVTDFTKSWSVIGTDRIVTEYDKPNAKKEAQVHAYSYASTATGRLISCSDGKCTIKK